MLGPRFLLRTPDFDACVLSSTQLKAVSMRLLREHEGSRELVRRHLKPKVLFQFVQQVEQSYFRNAFHNFDHAVDVTCWLSMQLEGVKVGEGKGRERVAVDLEYRNSCIWYLYGRPYR